MAWYVSEANAHALLECCQTLPATWATAVCALALCLPARAVNARSQFAQRQQFIPPPPPPPRLLRNEERKRIIVHRANISAAGAGCLLACSEEGMPALLDNGGSTQVTLEFAILIGMVKDHMCKARGNNWLWPPPHQGLRFQPCGHSAF